MDSLHVVTSHGPLSLIGRLHVTGRPTLLIVGGAFAPTGFKHDVADKYLGANVLVGRLPGIDAPWLHDQTLETLTAAFDEVLQRLVPGSPVVAHGVSTGCLVTMGLKSSNVFHHILEEPFLSTGGLWPIVEHFRDHLTNNPGNQKLRKFLWNFFGLSETEFEGRSYDHLLDDLKAPVDVIVGSLPLEPERTMDGWPSLTGSYDRERLLAHRLVTFCVAGGESGHGFGLTAPGRKELAAITLKALYAAAAET